MTTTEKRSLTDREIEALEELSDAIAQNAVRLAKQKGVDCKTALDPLSDREYQTFESGNPDFDLELLDLVRLSQLLDMPISELVKS